ncbi:SpoIIE family protein phosphatase [Couchioplanes caeruleus]|uniref:SpoIIE family protein phosphatase n=1 Tax=Couchioplanes caeruleus TaxID=56438 RepID=UPI001FD53E66|nr:SpoIIE family protein phosphatase [Couchioplanes caeruleus]
MTQELRVPWDEDPGDLYEHAPCGYLTMLPDGTIVKVNETFLAWTGFERRALIGRRRFRDLLSPGDKIYYETHYAPLLSMQDDVHEMAFDLVRADGRRLPILVNSILGRDPAGRPRVVRTTIFDATERRGYERELLAARRLAEASEQRVGALQQVVADLAAAATAAEVGEAVVRAPGSAFGAAYARVWLLDADRERLRALAGTEPGATDDDMPLGSSRPVAEVARRGDLHVIASVAEAERHFPELAAAMHRAGHHSVVLLPLTAGFPGEVIGADVLGVLTFAFTEERELTDSELRVVRLLGHQAGQALDRARLYDEARRREERAAFLAETTRALDEEPRLMLRARSLIDRLVPDVAEWAAVRLQVGPAGLQAEAGGPAPDPVRLAQRVALVGAHGKAELTGSGADPDCAVLPLAAGGKVLGTLALRMAPGRRPASADAVFLTDLADRAGLALENARLYEQERAVARTLQRSLLASDLPTDPRFAVETHYQAATHDLEVGGDWFDAFLITQDKLAVVVGDVVGRGIDAATTMGQLRSAIRALATAEAGPARLLERLDRFVDRVESARMATVVYAEVDLTTSEMTYACAGHLPPLLAEPGAAPQYLLDGRSGALGTRAGLRTRTEHRVHLAAGSRLLLYTDGLIERRHRRIDAGFEMLARAYAGRRDSPLPGLAAGLAERLVGREHPDDVCLLCLALGTEERLERAIGADPVQIALLRKDMRGWLASHDVDEDSTQAVLLACSEAVANAIEHGYRNDPFGVVDVTAVVSADAIEVRVTDRGDWHVSGDEVARGRGLQLIHQMMDDVTFDRTEGTTVTMRRSRREAV